MKAVVGIEKYTTRSSVHPRLQVRCALSNTKLVTYVRHTDSSVGEILPVSLYIHIYIYEFGYSTSKKENLAQVHPSDLTQCVLICYRKGKEKAE